MVLQEPEKMVQAALSDIILTGCRKTLTYDIEFSVEGMLHIVVDKKEVFLVNLKETILKSDEPLEPKPEKKRARVRSQPKKEPDSQPKRKRGRPRKKVKYYASEEEDNDADTEPVGFEDDDDTDYVAKNVNISGAFPNMQSQIGESASPADELASIKQEEPSTGYDAATAADQDSSNTQLQQLAIQLATGQQPQDGSNVSLLILKTNLTFKVYPMGPQKVVLYRRYRYMEM